MNVIGRFNFHVDIFNVDHQGKLNIQNYFNFMQEGALNHATSLGFGSQDLLKKNLIWVVTRMELHTYSEFFWNDSITLETWSRGLIGPYAFRDFKFCDQKGEEVAKASSSWIPIDLNTRKPLVLTHDEDLKKTSHHEEVGVEAQKIVLRSEPNQKISEFKVRNSDLDINMHVNNSKYIQWIYDSCELNELNSFKNFSINYQSEAVLSDTISLFKKDQTFQAQNADGRSIFTAKFF